MNKKTFTDRVLDIVSAIPKGSTVSYKEVAVLAGSPRAARAVGSIMKKNLRADIPCHRVIKASGEYGDYNRGGSKVKKKILEEEKCALLKNDEVSTFI